MKILRGITTKYRISMLYATRNYREGQKVRYAAKIYKKVQRVRTCGKALPRSTHIGKSLPGVTWNYLALLSITKRCRECGLVGHVEVTFGVSR